MPSFNSGGGARAKFVPFTNLGPWPAKFVAYREAPSKKFTNPDGTPKTNAFLDFQIIHPKVISRYPTEPVIKTLICSATIWKATDGTGRTSGLWDALKVLAGYEPTEDNIWKALTNAERQSNEHPTDKDLLNWIQELYGSECRVLLREIDGEPPNQGQTVDKLLPVGSEDGDEL